MSVEDRNELIKLFAGTYEEYRLLLLAGFPEISEETIHELIMRILSDSLFKKEPSTEKTQNIMRNDELANLAKAAIDKYSKN